MVSRRSTIAGALPDAGAQNWVDRFAPPWLRPYARLARWDRPIGWWLLLFPCWWSLALAAIVRWPPDPWPFVLFLVGAIAMRGAGCTWNDIIDRDIDAKVERTRGRPIPAGEVSVRGAAVFLLAQALVGLMVLLQFNRFTQLLGLAALIPVAIYPLMKRVTYWPQLFLGIAFSWGALMGWAASFGSLGPPALLLYAGCVLWTIGYDTIYALQDREEDALIGVRSTAILFGRAALAAVTFFYAGTVLLLAAAIFVAIGGLDGLTMELVLILAVAPAAAHLAWQVRAVRLDDPASFLAVFRSNRWVGWLVLAGLLVDAALLAALL
ncbi:MAG: 4-hydroxybenzoate octaprenyltransferase [Bauldia sp.]|nr:4-hydroxybenzoate octaprenyltransferase [Bauldia sp.]